MVWVRLGSYVFPGNLKKFLEKFDYEAPHFLGQRIVTDTTAYHHPRAGFALSISAVSALDGTECTQSTDVIENSKDSIVEREARYAQNIAQCSRRAGARVTPTFTKYGQSFNSIGSLEVLNSTGVTCARNVISFYHQDYRETVWLHSVVTNRTAWRSKSSEQRTRETQVMWTRAQGRFGKESWGEWLWDRLDGDKPISRRPQHVLRNQSLVWDFLLNKLEISDIENKR
ncbi:hypothetical protein AAMO2058_001745400 [Amorphochlora amoebiformis]